MLLAEQCFVLGSVPVLGEESRLWIERVRGYLEGHPRKKWLEGRESGDTK